MWIFSERLKDLLVRHGWHQDRCCDLTQALQIMNSEGYTVFDAALRFMQQFEGLSLLPEVRLDFFAGNAPGTFADVEGWMQSNQLRLCPVGHWSQYLLLLGEDQQLYVTDFALICRVEGGLEEALETLCFSVDQIPLRDVPPSLI